MACKPAPEIIEKHAGETRQVGFDFVDDLTTGDTVSSAAHVIAPITSPPLNNVNESSSGTQTQLTVSGGLADTEYTITVTANTTNGEVLISNGTLRVCA